MSKKDVGWNTKGRVRLWGTQIESQLIIANNDVSHGYAMTEHVHRYYELLFNFSPIPLRHTVAGHAYDTDTPFIIFRAPYILHSTVALIDQTYSRINVALHPCVFTEFGGICRLDRLADCWECVIPTTGEQMAVLEPLLRRLCRVRNDPTVPKRAWIGVLAALLYEVSELSAGAVRHENASPYMQQLLQYVVEHVEEDLSIDTLAEKFFVSRAKLTRDFRAAAHMSLHEYITAIRVYRAKMLLEEDRPLSHIAEQCGFCNESAFIRVFRHQNGITPGEYRKIHKHPG